MANNNNDVARPPPPRFGAFVNSNSVTVATQLAHTGYDWLLIDSQHGPMHSKKLSAMICGIQSSPGCKAWVRVASFDDRAGIQQALDLGADGILVPYVNTAEEAAHAVSCCRYPTAGTRSVYFPQRSTNKKGLLGYVGNANRHVEIAIQIETADSIKNIETISAVPGVTMLFLGQNDLCMSMGLYEKYEYPKMYTSPELNRATDDLIRCAKKNGKILGIFLFGTDRVGEFLKRGFTRFSVGNDLHHLMTQAQAHGVVLKELRPAAATSSSSSVPGKPLDNNNNATTMGNVLVTGAGGFLGSHVVEYLHRERTKLGVKNIIAFDRLKEVRNCASVEESRTIRSHISKWFTGDITKQEDVVSLFTPENDVNTVIHVASVLDSGTVPAALIESVNVRGTELLLRAAIASTSVRAFVYCSSLDVVVGNLWDAHDGTNEETSRYALDVALERGDKSIYHDVYAVSKTIAEKEVLKANGARKGFTTSAVRPVGLYGERDVTHVPILLKTFRDSKFPVKIGEGDAVFQHCYAGNCAQMLVLAGYECAKGNPAVGGLAFFGIDNTKVNNFNDFFTPYLVAFGCAIPRHVISITTAWYLFAFLEDSFLLLRRTLSLFFPRAANYSEFYLTRRAVLGLGLTQWFKTDKAKRLLGYEPWTTPMEARKRTIEDFRAHFTPGSRKYSVEERRRYDYFDEGKDYSPNDEIYRRGKSHAKFIKEILGITTLIAAGAGAWFFRHDLRAALASFSRPRARE